MQLKPFAAFAAFVAAFAAIPQAAQAALVTLESPELGDPLYDDDWRPGDGFTSGGAHFNNAIGSFENWAGFALSRVTDNTTPGFGNQYSAFAGSGAGGSLQYAIGYVDSFVAIPTITLPAGEIALSLQITNTTYAGISMRDGDMFAKKFGGPNGNDPDFFKLTITGLTETDVETGAVDFYLADFRSANPAEDYILTDWTTVDLSPLPDTTRRLRFTLESSDNNQFGMRTPAYFAVDNLSTAALPEPGTAALLMVTAAGGLMARRRRL